jgi:glutamine cyclotransferase
MMFFRSSILLFFLLLISTLGGVRASRATASPAVATIVVHENAIVISWAHDEANERYELHRSDSPYFAPGSDTLLQTFLPPLSATIIYTDASAALGDSHVNHYYRILSFDAAGASTASQRFAEFDFGDSAIPTYSYQVIHSYPHDKNAFTQGLVYEAPNILYEGTGSVGSLGSVLRKETLTTGEVLQERQLNDEPGENYFGEGITIWGNEIVQLTWRSHVGFVYDKATFEETDQFSYNHEGWGITHDGRNLIISDGTSVIRFWNPTTFAEVKRISVYDNEGPVENLNELEYVNGEIYANVWYSDPEVIARINPYTGRVVGWINLDGLKPEDAGNVLNGIAYDAAEDRLFVTGKLWPSLFEIALIAPE